ncbi:MAG: phosphoribosylglycinamide formyltransferase [Ignavibacteria bacterium]|nr:phosphoribosylglycinamide formyltransferase [Ignavibacteria bacterium]MBI3766192.1 phosphoribosylglycinamide formyltransferase [Ignavibacteriales bacterium]
MNIAVFASGKGSNFRAILDAITRKHIRNAHVVLVISNNSDAGALVIARENNIPTAHISRKQFASDEEFNNALLSTLTVYNVNFIVLAGYMKRIDPCIIRSYRNRIVNIHPALLPEFGGEGMYGMHVHEAVIARKATHSGATVHIVDEEYDHGPIVLQRLVPIADGETPATLAAKVLEIEHELYPEAIRLFAEGKANVDGQHVTITK